MPKSSKTPARTNTQPEDPKLYARIYASRLAKQVAEELAFPPGAKPAQEDQAGRPWLSRLPAASV